MYDSTPPRLLQAGFPPLDAITIVRAPDRGPLRTQITGRKTVRTFQYPSGKTNNARFGEAAAELAYIMAEEADVTAVDGVEQQVRVEARCGREAWTHVIDFTTLRSSGRVVLSDAKRDWGDFHTTDGRRQTWLGRIAADALGYGYERFVLASAGSERKRANVETVQAARFVQVPEHRIAPVARALAGGSVSLGRIAAMLHPVNGLRMAFALMVRRVLEIDLDGPLGLRSECRAVPPLPAGMPGIR